MMDSGTLFYDYDSEENSPKWKNLLVASLAKVQLQVHPGLKAKEDALLYVESLSFKLLGMLCASSPHTIVDVEDRINKTFPKPIDGWAIKHAHDCLSAIQQQLNELRPTSKLNRKKQKPSIDLSSLSGTVSNGTGNAGRNVLGSSSTSRTSPNNSIHLPVDRLHTLLQKELLGYKIDIHVTQFIVAILEYIAADILKLAGNYVKNIRNSEISCQDIKIAMCADKVLMDLFFSDNDDNLISGSTPLDEDGNTTMIATKRRTTSLSYDEIVKDVVHEEKQFINDLNLIMRVFREPLGAINCIKKEDMDAIFSNIDEIYELAVTLLGSFEDAQEAAEEDQPAAIGSCFEEMAENVEFDVYEKFAHDVIIGDDDLDGSDNEFDIQSGPTPSSSKSGKPLVFAAKEHLLQVLQRPTVVEALRTSGQGKHFDLVVKYILPKLLLGVIYHCFQYFEYLKLLSQLSPSEEDRESFAQAEGTLKPLKVSLERICSRLACGSNPIAASKRNIAGKLGENYLRLHNKANRSAAKQKIQELQKMIEGLDGKDFSQVCNEFIMEGTLGKISTGARGQRPSERNVFLFDGLMILCKPNNKRMSSSVTAAVTGSAPQYEYRLKERFYISKIEINDRDDPPGMFPAFDDISEVRSDMRNGSNAGLINERLHSLSGVSGISGTLSSASFSGLSSLNCVRNSFEIALRDNSRIVLFAKSPDEKTNWLSHLLLLNTRTMLERTLESILCEEEKKHPLQLPSPDVYRFAVEDCCYSNIIFEENPGPNYSGPPLIKGATLLKLVERLTYHLHADPNFVRTFLVTYRSFCSPQELMDLLIERFDIPEPDITQIYPPDELPDFNGEYPEHIRNLYRYDVKKFRKLYAQPVQFRVLNVLRHWIDHHYLDFEHDPELLIKLRNFLEEKVVRSRHMRAVRKWVESLKKVINRKAELVSQFGHDVEQPRNVTFGSQPPPFETWLATTYETMNILTLHPVELARQLTLIHFELFRALKPSELVDAAWTKTDKKYSTSPNLLKMMHDATNFTYWVEKTIVETPNFDERVAVVTRFLEILSVFNDLNNFSGIVALVSAINSACIHRLKHTMKQATSSQKLLRIFEEAIELSGRANNYKNLKEKLRSINPPCVPFCGMYLTHLVYINEGNPDYILNLGSQLGAHQSCSNSSANTTNSSSANLNSGSSNSNSSCTESNISSSLSSSINSNSPLNPVQSSGSSVQSTITSTVSSTSTLTNASIVPSENRKYGGLSGDGVRSNCLINFNKRRKVAEIIAEIQQYQNQPYCLNVEPNIRRWLIENTAVLHDGTQLDESRLTEREKDLQNHLYNKSQEIEPRDMPRHNLPKFPRKYPDIQMRSPGVKLRANRHPMSLPSMESLRNSLSAIHINEENEDGSLATTPNSTYSPSTPLTPPHSATSIGGRSDHSVFAPVYIGGIASAPTLPPFPTTPVTASNSNTPAFFPNLPPMPTTPPPPTPPPLPPRTMRRKSGNFSPQAKQAPDAPMLPPREGEVSPPPIPPRNHALRSKVGATNTFTWK